MTVTVTVPATMSSDGLVHTYTDDSDPTTGLDGGGHVERFTPAVKDVVSVANYVTTQAAVATDNVTLAQGYANAAELSAIAAAQQANTLTATSTTSTVIATGSKTFTTQAGEQFIAGQFVTIAQNGTPSNFMYGQVTSYSTTSLTVNVTAIGGSGTFADWLISLSGLQGVIGNTGATGSSGLIGAGNTIYLSQQFGAF